MSGRVVVDTNILVRAALSEKGREDAIVAKIGEQDWQLFYGRGQIEELVEVLGYERITKKYKVNEAVTRELIDWMLEVGVELEAEKIELCQDPDDNYTIGLAKRAAKGSKAFLVTGDKHILDLRGKVDGVEIVTPGEFLKREQVSTPLRPTPLKLR